MYMWRDFQTGSLGYRLPSVVVVLLALVVTSLSLPAFGEPAPASSSRVRLADELTRISALYGFEIRGLEETTGVLVDPASGAAQTRLALLLANYNYVMSESSTGKVQRVIILGARDQGKASPNPAGPGKGVSRSPSVVEVKIVDRPFDRAKFTNLVRASRVELTRRLFSLPTDAVYVSSEYGDRYHPMLVRSAFHRGVDFAVPNGTPVYAASGGLVVQRGWWSNYGKYVRIRHSSSVQTAYAHLSRIAPGIQAGARVLRGQVIGYVGSTGRSTGPHLHYEVLVAGREINPLRHGPLGP